MKKIVFQLTELFHSKLKEGRQTGWRDLWQTASVWLTTGGGPLCFLLTTSSTAPTVSNLIFLKCVKEQMMNSIEHHYCLQYNHTHTHTHTPAGIKASTDGLPTESRQKEMVEKNLFLVPSSVWPSNLQIYYFQSPVQYTTSTRMWPQKALNKPVCFCIRSSYLHYACSDLNKIKHVWMFVWIVHFNLFVARSLSLKFKIKKWLAPSAGWQQK